MIDVVRDAAVEVRKPTMFGELIIMIVYLPILTLEGIEGKLFRPMALTVIFALIGSMVLSLTLMPVLASLLLPRRIEEREPLLMRIAHRIYAPLLRFSMNHKAAGDGFAPCRDVRRVWADCAELGIGVRAAAVRRGDRDQRGAAGRDRSGRVDQVQHADGASGCWQSFPTRSRTSGAGSARPKSPPTRWGSS